MAGVLLVVTSLLDTPRLACRLEGLVDLELLDPEPLGYVGTRELRLGEVLRGSYYLISCDGVRHVLSLVVIVVRLKKDSGLGSPAPLARFGGEAKAVSATRDPG